MFITFFAVILRISANSLLNASQKKLSKAFSPLCVNFKTYFILTLFCLPLLFIMYFKQFSFELFFWALLGGVFGALGNAYLISALKYGELSVLGPVNSYKAVVSLVFGMFLLGETVAASAFFGMVLIIAGSYFIFESTDEGFSFKIFKRKDIRHRVLALVFTAIEAVFIKKVILLSDFVCSFFLWVIFGCLFSFVILKLNSKFEDKTLAESEFRLKPFFILAFYVLIMQLSTNFVFVRLPVALSLSLFQLSNVLNVFLGCKMFNEKQLLKKMIGSIIMVIGSCIILL